MIHFGVNLTYPPKSGLSLFRGWGEVPMDGVEDMCAKKFPLVLLVGIESQSRVHRRKQEQGKNLKISDCKVG